MKDFETIIKPAPIKVGAKGLENLAQCLRTIVSTFIYSVPLDRAFANKGSFIDSPLPHALALYMADLVETIEKYEPRIKVISLNLTDESAKIEDIMEGRAFPILRYRLNTGVTL